MKAYIVIFIFSMLFTYFAEKNFKNNRKILGIIFSVLTIFIVCFFAGIRSLDIGTDVKGYFIIVYNYFTKENYNIFQVCEATNVEIGFSLLMYISSAFKNVNVCLFVIQLATFLPIYLFAYKMRDKYSMLYIILIFLLTFYVRSFNLMRQSIAISLIILSISYYMEKKYRKTLILLFLACSFHITAIICIAIYLLYNFCFMKNTLNKRFYILFILLSFIFLTVFYEGLLKILPSRFIYYLNSNFAISAFTLLGLLKKLIWIIFACIYLNRYKIKNSENYHIVLFSALLLLIDTIFYFMGIKISSAARIGYYFLYTGYFIFIPKIKEVFKEKTFINIVIITLLMFFWYNMTVNNYQIDKTYPYKSDIIEILN